MEEAVFVVLSVGSLEAGELLMANALVLDTRSSKHRRAAECSGVKRCCKPQCKAIIFAVILLV